MDIVPIRSALLSVSDKTGLLALARELAGKGVSLLASGGTRAAIAEAGLPVTEVSAHTGQQEILGGRVKTLHPKIHGGLLARRDHPDDMATLDAQGISPIDLVVVNLYPFEAAAANPSAEEHELIEQIDIGGPSMIRSAAKNFSHVAVLSDPSQYEAFLAEFRAHGGTTAASRRDWARSVFERTSAYDRAIVAALFDGKAPRPEEDGPFPPRIHLTFDRKQQLRYGENPHQRAAFYVERDPAPGSLATARQVHGKELSYNNLLDLDSVLRLVRLMSDAGAAIIKHNNPCGAAEASSPAEAFELAYEGDPISAFGGIVGLNRRVDLATAERLCVPGRFVECVLAPGFDEDALALLTTKPTWKNSVRLLDFGSDWAPAKGLDLRRIEGGALVQDWDAIEEDPAGKGQVATRRVPSSEERLALNFAWRVCQSVRSNAIVLAQGRQLVGVGAGQMSRLDSVRIAIEKAGAKAKGAVLASDAFFPFRDGPDLAGNAGVTAIIQPGGSRRDDETLAACDEHNMAMILTGRRHFRH